MTEPSAGPAGPGDDAGRATPSTEHHSGTPSVPEAGGSAADASSDDAGTDDVARFARLPERPVTEHVEVFEAEHTRLQAELDTIDRL
jgi:hypothetical protein